MNCGHLLERICVGEIIAAVNFSSCVWKKFGSRDGEVVQRGIDWRKFCLTFRVHGVKLRIFVQATPAAYPIMAVAALKSVGGNKFKKTLKDSI